MEKKLTLLSQGTGEIRVRGESDSKKVLAKVIEDTEF